MPRLVLGSASPRRAALLREMGVAFEVRSADLDETPRPREAAEVFVRRVAREKGAAVSITVADAWVLSADTIVVIDGVALGKPVDAADARAMLERLSDRSHAVLTAVALTADTRLAEELLVQTAVEFRALSSAEIDAYIAGGEPFDKAGAYGIQGQAAAFVRRVTGSYTNVIGLPVEEVGALLERHGLWTRAPAPAAARRP
jgi:septum formation protein